MRYMMREFVDALMTYTFLQNAIAASFLSAFSCGISGTFVHVNRITFITGGIAHAVLGGVGAAVYFGFSPMAGAITVSILFAVILGIVRFKGGQHEDTVISALWGCGMSAGIIFIYFSPGYAVNLTNYLFGNILLVSKGDITSLFILAVIVFSILIVFYRQFVAVSFDEEYARLRGIKSSLIYVIMLIMIALTIVVLMKVVGLILVIAFLSFPAATASVFSSKMPKIIGLSFVFSFVFSLAGLGISYSYNLPTGAAITLVAGFVYIISILLRRYYERIF
jgi:zinc transport system permease protein